MRKYRYMPDVCERAYRRGKGKFQIRTAAGRLLYSGGAVEAVEFRLSEGRSRVLWQRIGDFGRVAWLAKYPA